MSSMHKEVGRPGAKYKTCPICGKGDWCCYYVSHYEGKDYEYILCNRYVGTSDMPGYKYVGATQNGVAKFLVSTNTVGNGTTQSIKQPEITKEVIKRFPDQKLDKLNRALLGMLKLEQHHRDKLKKDGFTDEMIDGLMVKSFPPTDRDRMAQGLASINPKRSHLARELLQIAGGDLTGYPGAFIKEYQDNRYWTLGGYEGMIFPIPNVYGEIVMLQVRLDITPASGGKYKVFSTDGERADGSKIYPNGCSPSSRMGLTVPKNLKDTYVCYITEGIKKAKMASERLGSLFVTVQGVNSFADLFNLNDRGKRNIDVIRDMYGVQLFVILYDNDKFQKGKEGVMKAEKSLINALASEGYKVGTGTWDGYMGKGIDDMFKAGYGFENINFQLVTG